MSNITTFDTIEYNDSSHIEEKNGLLQELQSLYQRREEEKLTIVSTVQRKSKKRKSNPIGKPHHLQEQKQQFDEADCSALSHLKSSQGTALSPILNRNPTISSFTVVPSVKRRSGLVRRTHSPITVVSTNPLPNQCPMVASILLWSSLFLSLFIAHHLFVLCTRQSAVSSKLVD